MAKHYDPNKTHNRQDRADALQFQPPYTWAQNLDLAANIAFSADGNGVEICELRCTTAGTIRVDLEDADDVDLYVTTYDIMRVKIKRVHRHGTDTNLRVGCITVFGFLTDLTTA